MAERVTSFARNAALTICGLVSFVVLLLAWNAWNFNRPPFDLASLQRLSPGMSKSEVRGILGSPTSDYGDQWAYSRRLSWPIVYIHVDDSGRFVESRYDY